MKIEHILLDYSQHFLVVDGKRGPLQRANTLPAMHPNGYFRYRSDAYGVPKELTNTVFMAFEVAGAAEEKKIETCDPADKAYTELVNAFGTPYASERYRKYPFGCIAGSVFESCSGPRVPSTTRKCCE